MPGKSKAGDYRKWLKEMASRKNGKASSVDEGEVAKQLAEQERAERDNAMKKMAGDTILVGGGIGVNGFRSRR